MRAKLVNHNFTTAKALLMAPVVDLWKLKKNKTFKNINYQKTLLVSLKGVLFLGFLYLWDYWTAMFLFFSDHNQAGIVDYMFTLIFNISIILSCFRCRVILRIICLLLLAFTTFLYLGILLKGKAWGFGCIGFFINTGALFFIWYNWYSKHEKSIIRKN